MISGILQVVGYDFVLKFKYIKGRLLMKKKLLCLSLVLLMLTSFMPISSFAVGVSVDLEARTTSLRTSVSQFGITWYFSEPVMAGQFVTGDWWVVGPVEIVDITPRTVEVEQQFPFVTTWNGSVPNLSFATHTVSMHGSMLNPHPRDGADGDSNQGFDGRLGRMRQGTSPSGGTFPGQFYPNENPYIPALNVARNLPLTLQAGDVLISSESFEQPALTGAGVFNPHNHPQLRTMAILTVLDSVAPEGAFRPPYIRPHNFGSSGNTASDWQRLTSVTWTVDDLDFDRLARVPLPEGVNFASPRMQTSCWWSQNNTAVHARCVNGSCFGCTYGRHEHTPQDWLRWITDLVDRPRIHIQTTWLGRNWHPRENFLPMSGGAILDNGVPMNGAYGRDMANVMGAAMLTLQLDIFTDEEKLDLLVHIVQYGIDIYGIVSAGGSWFNDGGHNMGRKMPMLLAGAVLNDNRILGFGDAQEHFVFHEDQQTFFVTQRDIDEPRRPENNNPASPSRPELSPFTQDMIGRPAWGQAHFGRGPTLPFAHQRSGANWSAAYREINSSPMMAHVLTARLMGLEGYWNWPALFEYIDLAAAHDRVAHFPLPANPNQEPQFHIGVISMLPFTVRMWNAHRWRTEVTGFEVSGNGEYLTVNYSIGEVVLETGYERANIVVLFFGIGNRFLNAEVIPVPLSWNTIPAQPACLCAHDLARENWLNPLCVEHPHVESPPTNASGTIENIEIPNGATYVRAMIWSGNLGNMIPLGGVLEQGLN